MALDVAMCHYGAVDQRMEKMIEVEMCSLEKAQEISVLFTVGDEHRMSVQLEADTPKKVSVDVHAAGKPTFEMV